MGSDFPEHWEEPDVAPRPPSPESQEEAHNLYLEVLPPDALTVTSIRKRPCDLFLIVSIPIPISVGNSFSTPIAAMVTPLPSVASLTQTSGYAKNKILMEFVKKHYGGRLFLSVRKLMTYNLEDEWHMGMRPPPMLMDMQHVREKERNLDLDPFMYVREASTAKIEEWHTLQYWRKIKAGERKRASTSGCNGSDKKRTKLSKAGGY